MYKNRWFYYFLYPVAIVVAFFQFPLVTLKFSALVLTFIPDDRLNLRSIIRHVELIVTFSVSILLMVLLVDLWFWISGRSGRNASKPPFLNRITRALFGK